MKTVFLDIESVKISTDFPDGWGENLVHWDNGKPVTSSNVLKMGVSLACTFDDDRFRFWDDTYALLEYLMNEEVGQIVTFNGEEFDIPLLISTLIDNPYVDGKFDESFQSIYDTLVQKSTDVLQYIVGVLGHRISLNSILQILGLDLKNMAGTDFHTYWTGSDVGKRVEAANYLMNDVIGLYKVHGCAVVNGMLGYIDKTGQMQRFNIRIPAMLPPF